MTTPFRQYLAPLEGSRQLIAGLVGAGLVLGILVAAIAPTRYESEAAIFISAISADPTESVESTVDNVDMETEVRIAESLTVADRAAVRIEGADAADIAANVSARALRDSRVLEITFEASSPDDARLGAQAVAEEYLAFRSDLAGQQTTAARDQIQENIDAIEVELATNPDAVRRTVIQGELAAHQEALARLSTVVLDAGEIIDSARAPSGPSTIGFLPIVLGAVAGSLAIAVGVAYLLDSLQRRQDGSIASAPPVVTEAGPIAGAQVVEVGAMVEVDPDADLAGPSVAVVAGTPGTAETEQDLPPVEPATAAAGEPAARSDHQASMNAAETRTRPLVAVDDLSPTLDYLKDVGRSGPVVAAVFDADSSPAAASVAFRIAWKSAELGARTLVIDVNTQASTAHAVVDQAAAPGLAEVLDGTSDLVDVVRQVSGPRHIALMTAGAPTDSTGWQLAGDRFADIVTRVKQHYQVVVLIGGRPTAASSPAVAAQADGMVLATRLPAGTTLDDPSAMASVALPAKLLATVSALGSDEMSPVAPAPAPMP